MLFLADLKRSRNSVVDLDADIMLTIYVVIK